MNEIDLRDYVAHPAEVRDYIASVEDAHKAIQQQLDARATVDGVNVNSLIPFITESTTTAFARLSHASESMPSAILSIYAPTMRALEHSCETAVVEALTESARMAVTHRVANEAHKQRAFRAAMAELIRGPDVNGPAWEEWGRRALMTPTKKKDEQTPPPPYEIPLDRERARDILEAAFLRSLVEAVHVAAGKVKTSREYMDARQLALVAANEAANASAREYRRVVSALIEITAEEQLRVLPRFIAALARVLEDLPTRYAELVAAAVSKDSLQAAYALELTGRLDAAATIFASYRHDAPLLRVDQRVPEAPKRRDLSVLLQTGPGAQIASLYEASRRVVPMAKAAFLSELPHNLVDVDLMSTDERIRHPMDRVERYFESRAFGGDGARMATAYADLPDKAPKISSTAAARAAKTG